ncbi:lysophospholipid acyltransferase family protein [Microbacterium gorillae]|uniref:lysophospholipid acyltransferase family protein n=1 Tax=Microbacterium gorillae TaxID=1231063 RepID=UPI000590FA92|nr:lysophospholipid acyltransferase family protein [Microbacterium gorillae]
MSDSPTRPVARPGGVYFVGRAVLRPLFAILFRARRTGRTALPRTGAVLLAANHLSGWDTVFIPVAASRPVQFLTKSSFFTGTGLRGRVSRWFFTSIGAVPVLRTAGHAAQAALDAGRDILRSGSVFAVFPEGTRSRDGRLYRGKTGAAWMALETGATVVPVGVIGTDRLVPFGWLLGRGRPEVRFGAPLDLSDLADLPTGRARRLATERIMDAIAALTGQDRADSTNASSADA